MPTLKIERILTHKSIRMPIKSVFEFPTLSDKVRPLTTNTRGVYRSKVNSIAKKTGYVTVQELIDNPKDVIKAIEELVPNETPNVKNLRRIYLSALMYVFTDIPPEQRTEYYEYYLTQKDPWVKPEATV
jgi:hypothetical protein